MQKPFIFFYAFLLAILGIGVTLMAEEITLTTYYPAPYGAYNELTVTGNVGIGTTGPATHLSIEGSGESASGYKGHLEIRTSSDGSRLLLGTKNIGWVHSWIQAVEGSASIAFRDLALNPQGGNVGIGTITPTAKLDVNGTVNATAYSTGGTAGVTDSFRTLDGETVTVTNGVITSIAP